MQDNAMQDNTGQDNTGQDNTGQDNAGTPIEPHTAPQPPQSTRSVCREYTTDDLFAGLMTEPGNDRRGQLPVRDSPPARSTPSTRDHYRQALAAARAMRSKRGKVLKVRQGHAVCEHLIGMLQAAREEQARGG